ncbi:MAG: DHH family phosphoesterase [Clostridia bacterium]|nr:DHH family phosphoesterase [Clostridia bacterium]
MLNNFVSLDMDALCNRLCENKKTLIIYHERSDADAVGSAFALKEIFRLMGIFSMCACADEVPERLKFLSEDTQGSVVIEDGMSIGHERVISVDSASPSQLGVLFDMLRKDIDLMIDHHGTGTIYADNYIDATASATGEIIFEIAKTLYAQGRLPIITPRIINCVYAAISSDTGGFRFANVTPRTHRIAAELLEAGAESARINHILFNSKTKKQMSAEGEAARRLKLHYDGRIASVTIPYSSVQSLGLCDENMETVIEIPRSVGGVEVAFSVRQSEPKPFFRVSMRSSTDFDVSAVCRIFGGGGHMRASGCSLEASGIEQAEQMLVDAIIRQMEKSN